MIITRDHIETAGAVLGVAGSLAAVGRWLLGLHWRNQARAAELETEMTRMRADWEACKSNHNNNAAEIWKTLDAMRGDMTAVKTSVARIEGYLENGNHKR